MASGAVKKVSLGCCSHIPSRLLSEWDLRRRGFCTADVPPAVLTFCGHSAVRLHQTPSYFYGGGSARSLARMHVRWNRTPKATSGGGGTPAPTRIYLLLWVVGGGFYFQDLLLVAFAVGADP